MVSDLRSCILDANELELPDSRRSACFPSENCCNEAEAIPGNASDSKYEFEVDDIVFI